VAADGCVQFDSTAITGTPFRASERTMASPWEQSPTTTAGGRLDAGTARARLSTERWIVTRDVSGTGTMGRRGGRALVPPF